MWRKVSLKLVNNSLLSSSTFCLLFFQSGFWDVLFYPLCSLYGGPMFFPEGWKKKTDICKRWLKVLGFILHFFHAFRVSDCCFTFSVCLLLLNHKNRIQIKYSLKWHFNESFTPYWNYSEGVFFPWEFFHLLRRTQMLEASKWKYYSRASQEKSVGCVLLSFVG